METRLTLLKRLGIVIPISIFDDTTEKTNRSKPDDFSSINYEQLELRLLIHLVVCYDHYRKNDAHCLKSPVENVTTTWPSIRLTHYIT